jgi:hypothetical protein
VRTVGLPGSKLAKESKTAGKKVAKKKK